MPDWDETTNIADPDDLPEVDAHRRDRAYVIVLAGSNVGEMYKVEAGGAVIGRSRRAQIRLLDDGISREHCVLMLEGDAVFVEDMNSRNGTFCNGAPVERQVLRDGDKIQVGRTTILKFTYHDKLDESFQRQMYDSALRDGLTQTFNKRYFSERIVSEYRFADRHRTPLSVLMIDIDHFKPINDTHGHPVGDEVLCKLAGAMQHCIRNEDVLARWGGEEFAVICRATTQQDARVLAERLRQTAESLRVAGKDGELRITISVGVAGLPDLPIGSPDELLEAADRALYAAKRGGRNRVEVARAEVESSE